MIYLQDVLRVQVETEKEIQSNLETHNYPLLIVCTLFYPS
jgi:hypothetical protein